MDGQKFSILDVTHEKHVYYSLECTTMTIQLRELCNKEVTNGLCQWRILFIWINSCRETKSGDFRLSTYPDHFHNAERLHIVIIDERTIVELNGISSHIFMIFLMLCYFCHAVLHEDSNLGESLYLAKPCAYPKVLWVLNWQSMWC